MGLEPRFASAVGVVELVLTALYLMPRTAPVGAVLWTGYLAGVAAAHARAGDPLLTHTLMPVYVAVVLWLPVVARDARVRALIARRSSRQI